MGSSLYETTLVDGALAKLPLAQNAYEPTISGKGDKLAFVSTISDGHMEIWRKDLLNPQAPGTQLVPSSFEQRDQEYAPDGRHIAFVSKRSGISEIWVSDADGRNLVQLSNLKDARTAQPHWSPDSQKVVFYSPQAGRGEAYIVDISDRMPRKLVTNILDIAFPHWSHDGRWIYFLPVGTNHGIYRCPANGGDADLLVALPQADLGENPQEAFDGETVYFSRVAFDTPLEMVSVKQPGTISVLQGMPKVLNLFAWTVVPGGIYFVPAEAPKSVHYFDFTTKQVRRVLEMEKDFGYGLSVSGDGRRTLYSQTGEINSNVMLVENFR
jgi:Tol biopolymer transport system component